MYTGDFSHQGNLCTFEVLADRFGLDSFAVNKSVVLCTTST
jgi:hypothetical protein